MSEPLTISLPAGAPVWVAALIREVRDNRKEIEILRVAVGCHVVTRSQVAAMRSHAGNGPLVEHAVFGVASRRGRSPRQKWREGPARLLIGIWVWSAMLLRVLHVTSVSVLRVNPSCKA